MDLYLFYSLLRFTRLAVAEIFRPPKELIHSWNQRYQCHQDNMPLQFKNRRFLLKNIWKALNPYEWSWRWWVSWLRQWSSVFTSSFFPFLWLLTLCPLCQCDFIVDVLSFDNALSKDISQMISCTSWSNTGFIFGY